MTIKHLVISGGGPNAIMALGAVQHLDKEKYLQISEIESIYATSAGAFLGAMICMKFDWQILNNYILNRPWHEAFPIHAKQILEAYGNKGIFDKKFIEVIFTSLLKAKDLSLQITLQELFVYSNIDFHVFSLELNEFKAIDISHTTHPELQLMDALHMTAALPIFISPFCENNKCFVDGGVISNYPLSFCLEQHTNVDEILGLKNNYTVDSDTNNNNINDDSTILDYMLHFIHKLIENVDTEKKQISIPNEITYNTSRLHISYIKEALSSSSLRKELLEKGIQAASTFLYGGLPP